MSPRSRAIVLRSAAHRSTGVLAAELRLAGLLDEITALESELELLRRALDLFEAQYAESTAAAFDELDRARRVLRRVRRFEEEIQRLEKSLREGPPPRLRRRVPRREAARRVESRVRDQPSGENQAPHWGVHRPPQSVEAAELDEEVELKAFFRRVARLLHPDLVRGDAEERARRTALMALANEAYRSGDRAMLELLAERVGAAACDLNVPDADRVAALNRRIEAMGAIRDRLRAERDELAGSDSAAWQAEARRRFAAGGDFFAETREGTLAEARAVREEALTRFDELQEPIRELSVLRMDSLKVHRRGWDPISESMLVRKVRGRLSGGALTPAARSFARVFTANAQSDEPWEGALAILALASEVAGDEIEPLSSMRALAERWDVLREDWCAAPDLGGAISMLPRQLEVGLRLHRDRLLAGLQFSSPDLAAGVLSTLGGEEARALARRVLSVLGPVERCSSCRADQYAVHLLRVRGVDEVHSLVCPTCGRVLKSYWRYGEPEGIEVLSSLALAVGQVVEQGVRLSGATLVLQMLPAERHQLTALGLLRRFQEVFLLPNGVDLPVEMLTLTVSRTRLAESALVPLGGRPVIAPLPGASLDAADLLAKVRSRVSSRFK